MKQIPLSTDRQENGQSSTELRAEVEQLSNIATKAIDSETQVKIQNLLVLIKKSLQQQQLSIEMQRELARLLSLISTLDCRNPQQIDILDLAISILLENKQDIKSATNSANKVLDKNSRNLVFIQEARRQIAIQSREYPHPFSAIIKGTGGAYNRLLSGLSWFFIIFVICPIVGGALTLFTRSIIIDKQKNIQFDTVKPLIEELYKTQQQVTKSDSLLNDLKTRLSKVQRELDLLESQLKVAKESDNSNQLYPKIESTKKTIESLQDNIKNELNSVNEQEKLVKGTKESDKKPEETLSKMTDVEIKQLQEENPYLFILKLINEKEGNLNNSNQQSKFVTEDFFETRIYFILVAVSMGALGSAVSIIVRANKFIEQGKEGQSDLFFTGFFRPIVGMSFAIFAVALIESGVFSGIFQISANENRTIYLYMAIAFVAGFSERLVEDVVLKTENTLTGFSSHSSRSDK
ncbi:hypothetical protein [Rivularia sp. UHCC 0363]|uniref:hypothetical protein n=1 Tax=Rivularia sp. UHCC 0363 TaxID=3110244 RepID=UPI002B21CF1C|nr:hypothetical protein [Rivularia sp. UHCC 0363]MEA5596902.1 hypothetical protein [Rivularia sp. UHCC 0363]